MAAAIAVLFCVIPGVRAEEAIKSEAVKSGDWAIGATAGTLGVGGEASVRITDTLVVRGLATYFAFDVKDFVGKNSSGQFSRFSLPVVSALMGGGMVDWHFFSGGWRLSAGAIYTDLKIKGGVNDRVDLGEHAYAVEQTGGVSVSAAVKNPLAPYVGVGYDAIHFKHDRWDFAVGFDAGVIFTGAAQVTYLTALHTPEMDADAQAQGKKDSDSVKDFNVFPVLMLSGKLSF
jgi:hypothetical protein